MITKTSESLPLDIEVECQLIQLLSGYGYGSRCRMNYAEFSILDIRAWCVTIEKKRTLGYAVVRGGKASDVDPESR